MIKLNILTEVHQRIVGTTEFADIVYSCSMPDLGEEYSVTKTVQITEDFGEVDFEATPYPIFARIDRSYESPIEYYYSSAAPDILDYFETTYPGVDFEIHNRVNCPQRIQQTIDEAYGIGASAYDQAIATNSASISGFSAINEALAEHASDPGAHIEITSPIMDAVDDKVDKITGKGLSTEDYTTAEKSKLSGVAAGATVNSTDATLLARANHTGSQAISTITSLQTALDAKVPTSMTLAGLDLTVNRSASTLRGAIMSPQTHITDAAVDAPTDASTSAPTDADTSVNVLALGAALNDSNTKQNSIATIVNANATKQNSIATKVNAGFVKLNAVLDALEVNNALAA